MVVYSLKVPKIRPYSLTTIFFNQAELFEWVVRNQSPFDASLANGRKFLNFVTGCTSQRRVMLRMDVRPLSENADRIASDRPWVKCFQASGMSDTMQRIDD